ATPVAAEIADGVTGKGHGEQKGAGHQQGGGLEHSASRQMHLDRPAIVSSGRDRDQRYDQRHGDATCQPDIRIEAREKHCVRIEEEVVTEQSPEGEAQRLDRPSRLRVCPSVELFDQRKTEHGETEANAEFRATRPAERRREGKGIGERQSGSDRQENRDRDTVAPCVGGRKYGRSHLFTPKSVWNSRLGWIGGTGSRAKRTALQSS